MHVEVRIPKWKVTLEFKVHGVMLPYIRHSCQKMGMTGCGPRP
jgi:hypothetical protein